IITGESGKSAKNNNKFGNTTPQIKNLYSVNNVYIIDNVSNLNTAKARLTNIIKNGDMGTAITQDSLDQTIANALGARSLNDASIYSILTDLEDGDTFIIKDKKTMCLVLTIKNDTLVKLSNSDVDNLPELYSYMNGCSDISE
ncbi:MAG: hypothetical protein K2M23_00845, partial [Alphaproteobacteria bacterium]|nr:hypothetical protein [Alphaproteobacteria bacterium]